MILVTGGTGFVGRHLVRRLQARGERVRCTVRDEARARAMLPSGVELVQAGLEDGAGLERALDGVERVIHVAGLIKAAAVTQLYAVNAAGTKRLCDAVIAARPRLRRLVYVSSLAAAGPSPPDLPRDEATPEQPISHYGRSKLEGEAAVRELGRRIAVTIVRPPAVYGPEDPEMLKFFQVVRRGLRPAIGLGARWLSLVHVDDLVRCLAELAFLERAEGKTYFVAEPEPYTWSFLFGLVARVLGRRTVPVIVPETLVRVAALGSEMVAAALGRPTMFNRDKARELCARAWTCRATRLEVELGLRCEIRATEGFPSTIAWYRERGWL